MKKLVALVLVLMAIVTQGVLAETVDISGLTLEELKVLRENVETKIAEFGESESAETEEAETIETLQKGSKGEAVKKLQKRLIELNYLSGSADGDYGNNTKNSVALFQKAAGLTDNGIADPETQKALFAEDAPVAKTYLSLNFKAISRDPGSYEGKNYKFSGKVKQVLEEQMENYTYVAMRIATKGNYDDIVYVTYLRDNSEARVLEDDRVTVYAECLGLYTYETVIGGSVTLPNFFAETVTLN